MPRVAPAPAEQVEPLFGPNAPLRLQIYAQRPPLAEAFVEFGATLRRERLLSDRLIELVRLRVAFWNQCRSCMAVRYEEGTKDGLTEALVCSLERPEDADDLTERRARRDRVRRPLRDRPPRDRRRDLRTAPRALRRGGDRRALHERRALRRLRPHGRGAAHGRRPARPLPGRRPCHPVGRRGRRPHRRLGDQRRRLAGRGRAPAMWIEATTIGDLVDRTAEWRGDHEALVFPDARVTLRRARGR